MTDLKLTGRIRIIRSYLSSICKSEIDTYSMFLSTEACVKPNIIDWSRWSGCKDLDAHQSEKRSALLLARLKTGEDEIDE